MLISVELARVSPISEVFKNHKELFTANIDRDFLILVTFLMYERMKGLDSFWNPYFDAVNPGLMTALWPDSVI